MSYRILSCTVCATKLRFVREVERNSLACPECGNGMELLPKDIVARQKLAAPPPIMTPVVAKPAARPVVHHRTETRNSLGRLIVNLATILRLR